LRRRASLSNDALNPTVASALGCCYDSLGASPFGGRRPRVTAVLGRRLRVIVMNIRELEGRVIEAVDGSAAPHTWVFRFVDASFISIGCDWRIVVDGSVAVACGDHQQLFGRQAPLDAVREASQLLKGKAVVAASLSEVGDVLLRFAGGVRLETFTNSCGYESCTIGVAGRTQLVIVGGGRVVEF
jgi:hypothetical protein